MQAIDVYKGSYVRLSTLSAVDTKNGFSFQAWVRPMELADDRAIFECAQAGGDWSISLLLLSGGQLRLRVADTGVAVQLETPRVADVSRWFHVSVTLSHDGGAALYVDGTPIAAGKTRMLGNVSRDVVTLGVAAAAKALPIAASFGETRLWGRALRAEEVDAYMREQPGPDGLLARVQMQSNGAGLTIVAAEGPRSATPVGVFSWRSDDEPDLLPILPRGTLQLTQQSAVQMPALVTSLGDGVTFEAWVRPGTADAGNFMELGRIGDIAMLTWKLDSRRGGMQLELVEWPLRRTSTPWFLGLRVGVWQHIAVTLTPGGTCLFFINGREVGRCSTSPMQYPRSAVTGSRVGAAPGCVGVLGEVAELRVWQRAQSPADIAQRWLRRARGDEADLAYCYHCDSVREATLLDASRGRRHGKLTMVGFALGVNLPLRPFLAGPVRVQLDALLRQDDLPTSLFSIPQVPGSVLPAWVKLSVYEVRIELRGRDGAPRGGDLRVRVDEAVQLVRSDAGAIQLVDWAPGVDNYLTVPASGSLRLRILAHGHLDCPALRVCPSGPSDCWTVLRPAEVAQGQLSRLSATSLQQPPAGKRAVLPATLAADDAQTLSDFIAQLAPAASGSLAQGRGLFDPVVEWIEGAADDAATSITETSIELTNGAKKLVLRAGDDVKNLYDAAATYGSSTIGDKVENASELAIDTTNSGWGVVELVGKTADGAFRVVLTGVADMVDAIAAVLERIGSDLRTLVDYLALLLRWDKILATSDKLYDDARARLAALVEHTAALGGFEAAFDEFFADLKQQPIAQQTVGELLHLPPASDLPAALTYLQDLLSEGLGAGKASIASQPPNLQPPIADDAAAAGAATLALLPEGLLNGLSALEAMPMSTLLALPDSLWQASKPVAVPTMQWLVDKIEDLVKALTDAMTAHLDVPVLTETLEGSLLGGRSLNLLRLVALVGAIPATLATADSQRLAARASVTDDALRWTTFGAHLVGASLMVGRAAAEQKKDKQWLPPLTICAGAVSGLIAGINWYQMTQIEDSRAKKAAIAHASFESLYALWQVALGISLRLYTPDDYRRNGLDIAIDVLCGLGEVGASVADLVLSAGDPSDSARAIGFRATNWFLRGCYKAADGIDTTKVKHAGTVTIVLGGVIVAVDLADIVWELVDTAQG